MFVFITPLKSRKVSNNWEKTCQLFERTLKSVCSQRSTHYSVLVVCHEKPNISFSSDKVQYLQVDFPPPDKKGGSAQDWYFRREIDKNRKLLMGLCHAKHLSPSYVMPVDADDCISDEIVGYSEKNPGSNGWFLNQGYLYNQVTNRLVRKYRKFNLMCGTSHIINYDLIDLPDNPEYDRGYGYYRDHVIFLKHDHIRRIMQGKGKPLKPLPFPGAVYITENSENIYFSSDRPIYGNKIENFLGHRPVTPKIQEKFSLNLPEKLELLVGSC